MRQRFFSSRCSNERFQIHCVVALAANLNRNNRGRLSLYRRRRKRCTILFPQSYSLSILSNIKTILRKGKQLGYTGDSFYGKADDANRRQDSPPSHNTCFFFHVILQCEADPRKHKHENMDMNRDGLPKPPPHQSEKGSSKNMGGLTPLSGKKRPPQRVFSPAIMHDFNEVDPSEPECGAVGNGGREDTVCL